MLPETGPLPRRARQLIPAGFPRRGELIAACAVLILLAHLLLAQLTLVLAVLFAIAGRVTRWRLVLAADAGGGGPRLDAGRRPRRGARGLRRRAVERARAPDRRSRRRARRPPARGICRDRRLAAAAISCRAAACRRRGRARRLACLAAHRRMGGTAAASRCRRGAARCLGGPPASARAPC